MKKFLVRLLIFLLPVIVLAYPVDVFISQGLRHSSLYEGEIQVWDDIYSGNLKSECLIYGSSRTWVHFDAILMEKITGVSIYGLGMDAHNFWMQKLRHNEMLKHNPKPKTIIYSLDMFTLEKRSDLFNRNQFLPFMLWNRDIEKATESYEGFTKPDFYIPMYRYIGQFSDVKSGVKEYIQPDDPFRIKGYRGMDWEWNSDLDKAKATIGKYQVKLDTASVRLFGEFLKECKQEDISLIFVYSPEYIDGQQFIEDRDKVMNMYRNWAGEYDIPFLDYSADSISYNRDYFYNSMHMNIKGSQLFSEKLAYDLLKNNLLKAQDK